MIRVSILAAAAAAIGLLLACAHLKEKDEARAQAHAAGKYKVQLSTDREKIQGNCKFLGTIEPSKDPVGTPLRADMEDYYREEGVLMGADTVLLDGRLGEAYVCGPAPLNPDGSPQKLPK